MFLNFYTNIEINSSLYVLSKLIMKYFRIRNKRKLDF